MAVYPEPSTENAGHSGLIFGGIFAIVLIAIMMLLVVFLRRRFQRLKSERAIYIANSDTGKFGQIGNVKLD